jgi:hypothetical protein
MSNWLAKPGPLLRNVFAGVCALFSPISAGLHCRTAIQFRNRKSKRVVDGNRSLRQIPQVLQRDPRLRPFRAAMWVVYFLAIALPVGALINSVIQNLSGVRTVSTGPLPTRAVSRVCAEELDALNREQNQRAWKLGGEVGSGEAVARFEAWAIEWEQRVGDLGDRCRLDQTSGGAGDFAGREELARARDAVLELHRAYRAQVNRFAQEQAELARAASAAVELARSRAGQGP